MQVCRSSPGSCSRGVSSSGHGCTRRVPRESGSEVPHSFRPEGVGIVCWNSATVGTQRVRGLARRSDRLGREAEARPPLRMNRKCDHLTGVNGWDVSWPDSLVRHRDDPGQYDSAAGVRAPTGSCIHSSIWRWRAPCSSTQLLVEPARWNRCERAAT